MANGLDPDKDWHFVSPYLGPNCLQRISADEKLPLAKKKDKHTYTFSLSQRHKMSYCDRSFSEAV